MIEIVQDYLKLKSDISILLKKSGFKTSYIAEKLGIPQPTFSVKKQRANWNEAEMLKIVSIIENDDLEDFYFGKMMSDMNETEFVSLSDFKKDNNR
ncbi:MAG: hypothetical protein KA313_03935 [Pseudarcicella sp.]|nr:hypothetical protein [Pseudarcicella sp.]MBP6410226.1 hypothetical protein [Pseudarcicella sp.]